MLHVEHVQMDCVTGLTNGSGIVCRYTNDMAEAKESR